MKHLAAVVCLALLSACGGGAATVQSADPAPTVSLSSSVASVTSGGSATLTWSSTNATSCTASGSWSGSLALSGNQSTGALDAARTYTLTCTGKGGQAQTSVTVNVTGTTTPAPTVSVTANPTTVASGGSSTLTWTTTNATTCTASGGWSGSKAVNGTQSTGALSSATTFTLACTGAGGNGSGSATVAITVASGTFPLHTDAGKRYLIDASGNPFLIQGDAAWDLISTLTNAEVDQYLEDRRQKGFNTVLVELMEHFFSPSPPRNAAGDAPFLTAGDYSTPNEAYFAHAQAVIDAARAKGMLVLLTPSYMGFNGGSEGWYSEMSANGATKLTAFGTYIANRFSNCPNIIWVQGGDYNPPDRTLLDAIPNGIRAVNTQWPHTFHGARGTSALGFVGSSTPWLSVNDIYTDETNVVASAFTEYARATMPFFLIEDRYEGDNSATALTVRSQAYQAVLSGASGQIMGNATVWRYASGWQTALNSGGAVGMKHLRELFDAHSWWMLPPDTAGSFLTSGTQTDASRAAAAVASDGSFALIYTPSSRALGVSMAGLSGPHVTARWYDPTSGTYSTISGSPFNASGTQTLTPPGAGDWVLVLESAP